MEGRHPWKTKIRVKGSERRPFIITFRFNIGVYNFNHMNEFLSISELMQSRKDKINSEDITETFLFSLIDSSIKFQIVERVPTVKLFYF